MAMLVPFRISRRQRLWPFVNLGLIVANVVVFFITWWMPSEPLADPFATYQMQAEATPILRFYLYGEHFHWWQLITYAFLHGGLWHLLMNMVFLFVFGNAVEDRLGRVGYFVFYMAAAVVAGFAHMATSEAPVIGASGAVAAVTGAFLVLYPRVEVEILFFFMPVERTFPGWVIILLYVGLDVYNLLSNSGGNVAYTAHLGGYAFGFVICLLLLWARLIDREPYDLFADVYQVYRRRQFRKVVAEGYDPWMREGDEDKPRERTVLAPEAEAIRRRTHSRVRRREYEQAAADYRSLQAIAPGAALRADAQMDVANQLMSEGDYKAAAAAYELMVKQHNADPQAPRAQLLLGLIYTRYLNRPAEAMQHLKKATRKLTGDDRATAESLIVEAEGKMGAENSQ